MASEFMQCSIRTRPRIALGRATNCHKQAWGFTLPLIASPLLSGNTRRSKHALPYFVRRLEDNVPKELDRRIGGHAWMPILSDVYLWNCNRQAHTLDASDRTKELKKFFGHDAGPC